MTQLPLQRRARRAVVRFQARLERGGADRWIPTAVAATLAFVVARLGLSRYEGLLAGNDLAAYVQSSWLLSEGYVPRASLFGTDVHLLELRWSFVMYVFGALARVVPVAKALIVAQALALGITVYPLWGLARRVAKLRVGAATALVLAYALHPVTHRLGIEDFHPETLAVPALVGVAYFGATKRWVWYWICFIGALACRADLGLALAPWGLLLLGDGERRAGLWSLGVGSLWTLALLLVGQPIIAQPGGAVGRSGYGGYSLGDMVLTSLRDPLAAMQGLVTQDHLVLLVGLLAPVIFLPLLSLRHLLPVLPLAGLLLYSDTLAPTPFAERAAVLLAFIMIAAVYALNRLGHMGVDRVFLDVRLLTTVVAASVLFFVATSISSPYEQPWTWSNRDATDDAIVEAVAMLDRDVPVRASPAALPLLAERPWLYQLDSDSTPSPANMGFPAFTRAVLVVEREIPERSEQEREAFDLGMQVQGFILEMDRDGVMLYLRDS